MRNILRTEQDYRLLLDLLDGRPPASEGPTDYAGFVVVKPWGYEFQVYDNNLCSIWLACLKPGQAVSLHCHQRKRVIFIPMSDGITFKTLDLSLPLNEYVSIESGVFHSQENNSAEDGYFLECEYPSEKTDLIRYKDRYGREGKPYEGRSAMRPMAEYIDQIPGNVRCNLHVRGWAA